MKFEKGQMQVKFHLPFFAKERSYVVNENKIETKSKTNQNTDHMERDQKTKSAVILGGNNDDLWGDLLLSAACGMGYGVSEL